jgi:hypothetical protein
LHERVDESGDKHASILLSPWPMLVAAIPVKQGDQLVGAIAVGAPLSEITARLTG